MCVSQSDWFFLTFLNARRPDGVQLTAEQLREHEAIDIKVHHNKLNFHFVLYMYVYVCSIHMHVFTYTFNSSTSVLW